jgi:tetratricopeptide (TPR) repeat protein
LFWLAQFRYLLGTAWWGLGDMIQARAEFQQALAHCDAIGEQRFKAHMLDLLAYIHLEQGATAEAMETANEALRMSNACGDHLWVSHLQVILGRIALAQGRRSKAHKHGLAALQFARASGELFILQEALHLLGDVELVRSNLDEAERQYAESMTAIEVRGIDHYFLQAAGLVGLGNVALARGDLALAEQHFERALTEAGSVAWDEAHALYGLAQVYAGQGKREAAVLFAERVIEFLASPARVRAACARLLREQ